MIRFEDSTENDRISSRGYSTWRIVMNGTGAHHQAARDFMRAHNPDEWGAMQKYRSES